jgi:hypothetical protein
MGMSDTSDHVVVSSDTLRQLIPGLVRNPPARPDLVMTPQEKRLAKLREGKVEAEPSRLETMLVAAKRGEIVPGVTVTQPRRLDRCSGHGHGTV